MFATQQFHNIVRMWQSRVEIENYSTAYFGRVTTFEALYCWTSGRDSYALHKRIRYSCIRYSRIYKAHMSPALNPLTTNDDYSCHRTSPACYQLVQSVFFCEEVLALWASYLLQCPYPVVYTVAMSRTDAAQEFWGWTIDAVFVYTRSVNHIHNAIFISMEMLTW